MAKLVYGLNDKPGSTVTVLASIQWLVFILANVITVPVVLGQSLGMSDTDVGLFVSRTFVVCGIIGLIQIGLGHGFPIVEGPAGTWWGVFVVLIGMTKDVGGSIPVLEQELEAGLIVGGLVFILLVAFGLIGKIRRLFTPIVTGTFMLLLSLQLSKSLVGGMLGIGFQGSSVIQLDISAISLCLVAITVGLMVMGRGLWRSFSVLIGLLIGWITFAIIGKLSIPPSPNRMIAVPAVFPWGPPKFQLGVCLTCAITAIVLMSNLIASVQAMGDVVGENPPAPRRFTVGTLMTGVGTGLAGLFGTVGNIPLATASSLVSLTGIAARLPYTIACVILIILGLLPEVGRWTSTLPSPVGYAVLFTVFGQLLGLGLKDFQRLALDERQLFIITLSILAGTGMFFVSGASWVHVNPIVSDLVGNGLILGVALVLILEHLVFRPAKVEHRVKS